ncbi:thioredoxin family protein [Erythrobacter sp. W53]|uniref:thioredoxin family protein n=1 Tax=Erythrobacter sp. W53 TaxID=3425947 RepID=UPI003D7682FB
MQDDATPPEAVHSGIVNKRLAITLGVCASLLLLSLIALGTLTYKTGVLEKIASGHAYPEAELYDASIDAGTAVDDALARAQADGKHVLLVLGANWCHDSRAFAGWMETERFQTLITDRFELVYVNVGMPQSDDGHNLGIAQRFGFESLEGTPTVIAIAPNGEVQNSETAKSWRNTASRSEDEIYDELIALSEAQAS